MNRPPLILIGTHRSGTTWLGDAFSQARDIAYWSEPRHIWEWGNWFRDDDVLTELDARPRIRRYIQRRFTRFAERRGKNIFCEKTPANCLRIGFVMSVFPDARLVLIVRDGRSVLRSTEEILDRGGARWQRMAQRVAETRLWEWPAHLSRATWVTGKLRGQRVRFWGVRPPGWKQWLADDDPRVILARQWASSIGMALDGIARVPADQRLVVRYEDLVADRSGMLGSLVAFSGTADGERVVSYLERTREPHRANMWRDEIDPAELERLRPFLEPTLQRLNYEW